MGRFSNLHYCTFKFSMMQWKLILKLRISFWSKGGFLFVFFLFFFCFVFKNYENVFLETMRNLHHCYVHITCANVWNGQFSGEEGVLRNSYVTSSDSNFIRQ